MAIHYDPIPLDLEIISLFLFHLALEGLAYVTINNQGSEIITFGKLNGCDMDVRGEFGIRLTLLGL